MTCSNQSARLGRQAPRVKAAAARCSAFLGLFVFMTALPAAAQPNSGLPECPGHLVTIEVLSVCFEDARPSTAAFVYAGSQLGSEFAILGDYASAARVFDRLDQSGDSNVIEGSVLYHALQAETYWRVERTADGLTDARHAYALLKAAPASDSDLQLEIEVLARIVPALFAAADPLADEALAYLKGLEIPVSDALALANRAYALFEVGEAEASIAEGPRALAANPDWAPAHNNLCYALARTERASEALPHCNRAVALMPGIAAFHHSRAVALAVLGRCTAESAAQGRARALIPKFPLYQGDVACTPAPRLSDTE